MSPVGAIFVLSPPKTGTNLLHPRPPPIVERVTATPVATVQYCSPSPQTPEPSPDVCFELESNKDKMDPKLKELESSSAGTGLETPAQQCPPNEGTWETGRTTADGFLIAGVGSNRRGNISSPTEHGDMRVGTAATPAKRRH